MMSGEPPAMGFDPILMIGDFRLMNDSRNKKMYVVNLSGEPPGSDCETSARSFCLQVITFCYTLPLFHHFL